MTITATTTRIEHVGDGLSLEFAYPYRFLENADLYVYVDGTLQTITTDYTVSGAGSGSGGAVEFLVAPASGLDVVIVCDPAQKQETDYKENDPFPAESHENALDRLTLLVQRVSQLIGRALRLVDSDTTGVSTELPTPEANKLLGWNNARTAIINISPNATDADVLQANLALETGAAMIGAAATTNNSGATVQAQLDNIGSATGAENVGAADGAGGTLWTTVAGFITKVMSSVGCGVIGYIHSLTGAVARTVLLRLRDEVWVTDFGAVGDGLTDNTAAFAAAIAAHPSRIRFPAGTFLGVIAASSAPIMLKGAGRNATILKNNSVSSELISLSGSAYVSDITEMALDNNNVPAHTISATGYYCNFDQLRILNHGNDTAAGKYGIYLNGATSSKCSNISFSDVNNTYGGHVYSTNTIGVILDNIQCGRGGSDSSVVGVTVIGSYAANLRQIVQDDGAGGGALLLQGNYYSILDNAYLETTHFRDTSAASAHYQFNGNYALSARSLHIQNSDIVGGGTVIPNIYLNSNIGVHFDGIEFDRKLNSSVKMIDIASGNSNLIFDNIVVSNQVSVADATKVDYTLMTSSGIACDTVSIRNQKSRSGGGTGLATIDLDGLTNVMLENYDATLTNLSQVGSVNTGYKTGSWTPTPNANLTISSGATVCKYVKIGQQVTLQVFLTVGTVSGTDAVTLSIPFASSIGLSNNQAVATAAVYTNGIDFTGTGLIALIGENSSVLSIYEVKDNDAPAALTNAGLTAGDDFGFTITYFSDQ